MKEGRKLISPVLLEEIKDNLKDSILFELTAFPALQDAFGYDVLDQAAELLENPENKAAEMFDAFINEYAYELASLVEN